VRAEVLPTHDVHNFYLRWEVGYDGREKERLAALGGPVVLEIEVSCYIDLAGNRHETGRVKIAIWPFPGPKNVGQARFWDVDSRRRFWVTLQGACVGRVVDEIWDREPGSVGAEGLTIFVPERPGVRPPEAPAPAAGPTTTAPAAAP
jgi:hypothetical protein